MLLKCAARHFCVAKNIPVSKMHKCRKCNRYLHTFCAGQGLVDPNFDVTDGKEFDCAWCTGGILLKLIPPPPGAPASEASSTQVSELDKGELNQCCGYYLYSILYCNCCGC